MKANIDTLVRDWAKDNKEYIAENFTSLYDWIFEYIRNSDTWQGDFFTEDEILNKTWGEMSEEVLQYMNDRWGDTFDMTSDELIDYINNL